MTLPRLGAAMIVKNEAATIRPCLESLRPHIGYWVCGDTGSDDDTEAVVREVFAGIPGEMLHIEWDGFGPARSQTFAAIHGKCEWWAATDADMVWSGLDDFVPPAGLDGLTVQMGAGGSFRWRLPLVLNGSVEFVSIGRAHEFTARADGQTMRTEPTDAVRVTYPDRSSPAKSQWQLDLLQRDLADDPENPRTLFYMSQCLRELGRDVEARHLYLKRAAMTTGWSEEADYAAFRAALLAPEAERVGALLAAWERRPERLEPLSCAIGELNRADCHRTAYTLIPDAWPAEAPEGLFVADDPCRYGLMFEKSIAAWYVGRCDESRALSAALLARDDLPPAVRAAAERNLALTDSEEEAA